MYYPLPHLPSTPKEIFKDRVNVSKSALKANHLEANATLATTVFKGLRHFNTTLSIHHPSQCRSLLGAESYLMRGKQNMQRKGKQAYFLDVALVHF